MRLLLMISDMFGGPTRTDQDIGLGSYGDPRSPLPRAEKRLVLKLSRAERSKFSALSSAPKQPSVRVAKRERVAATGAVDQVSGYLQAGEDLSDPRDVIADLFWEQGRVRPGVSHDL